MIDLVVVLCMLFVGLALLLPSVQQSREDNRLQECKNKTRALVLAALNREAATTRFPLAMSGRQAAATINNQGPVPFSDSDGFSWVVSLLPYLAERTTVQLYDDLVEASMMFSEPMHSNKLKKNGRWILAQRIESLICPSVPAERHLVRGKYKGLGNAQVSNYLAMVAGCVEGSKQSYADRNPMVGGMIVTKQASPKGLKIGDAKDGTSKSLLFGESNAELYSFWFSGRSSSTIGMPPDLVPCSRLRNRPTHGFPELKAGIIKA